MFENSFTIFVVKRFTIKRKRIHVSDTLAWVLVSLGRWAEEGRSGYVAPPGSQAKHHGGGGGEEWRGPSGRHFQVAAVGFQMRIPPRCPVRSRGSPGTGEGCPVRSHRKGRGIEEKEVPLKAWSAAGWCALREPHGRESSTTENCPMAGTCPGARLGTDEVHLHRGPTELMPVGASALPLPFEAPNSARVPLPTLLTDPRGPPTWCP